MIRRSPPRDATGTDVVRLAKDEPIHPIERFRCQIAPKTLISGTYYSCTRRDRVDRGRICEIRLSVAESACIDSEQRRRERMVLVGDLRTNRQEAIPFKLLVNAIASRVPT